MCFTVYWKSCGNIASFVSEGLPVLSRESVMSFLYIYLFIYLIFFNIFFYIFNSSLTLFQVSLGVSFELFLIILY